MSDEQGRAFDQGVQLQMVADIVTAYVSNNPVPVENVPDLIRSVHDTLAGLAGEGKAPAQKPAVPIRKSVTDDYIICLEDGRKLKVLKRYLRSRYNMTPEEYRAKWNLPADYPMVAPAYARKRAEFAKKIGLGRRGGRRRSAGEKK
ncbi:MAG: MucR family transcriptional regulator [Rhodothalassiaceae bacterium]|nr:MAG: MucR family transcriptional regulator [Rhodothalassiaceae bacterium]